MFTHSCKGCGVGEWFNNPVESLVEDAAKLEMLATVMKKKQVKKRE